MFSATVDAVERFFVENHFEVVFLGHFRHEYHQKHILVNGFRRLTEHRGALELVRGHLIVSCLKLDSEFVCLCLKIFHECFHAARNSSEIVVGQLLVFG